MYLHIPIHVYILHLTLGDVLLVCPFLFNMAIRVVEFSNGGYKIRKILLKATQHLGT